MLTEKIDDFGSCLKSGDIAEAISNMFSHFIQQHELLPFSKTQLPDPIVRTLVVRNKEIKRCQVFISNQQKAQECFTIKRLGQGNFTDIIVEKKKMLTEEGWFY